MNGQRQIRTIDAATFKYRVININHEIWNAAFKMTETWLLGV